MELQLEKLIKMAKERLQEAIANLKPVKTMVMEFVGTIFGIILWPLVGPTLWMTDKISGSNHLQKYHGFLGDNLKRAYEFSRANPWTSLAMALGLAGSITLVILTAGVGAGAFAIGLGVGHLALTTVGGIGLGGGYAIACYNHRNEIKKLTICMRKKLKN